jgi:hypothetical protein
MVTKSIPKLWPTPLPPKVTVPARLGAAMLAAAATAPAATPKTRDRVDRKLVNLNRNIRQPLKKTNREKLSLQMLSETFRTRRAEILAPPLLFVQCLGIGKNGRIVKIIESL